MMKESLVKAINEQINKELNSEYIYLDMVTYFENEGLSGFAQFFKVQVEEERFHAMKFFQYLVDRNAKVVLTQLDDPRHQYKTPLDVMDKALGHEKYITNSINDLMSLAIEEKDYATVSMLNWFIDEQVEEEATMNAIIDKLKMIEGSGRGNGLMMLDRELGTRVFTPEV
ncbi:MAG: ferritin [Candidatus Cloacimonadales bacterium]